MDATDLITPQQNFEKLARELERSNRDLELFAFFVSHDLKEPMRMVTSYLSLLENKCEPLLDTQAREFIHYASDGAKRMVALIDSLLKYSRFGNSEIETAEVSASEVMREVLLSLKPRISESSADILCGPLPTVWADRVHLGQVFQNITSNALKFSRPGVPPKVRICATETPVEWVFRIQDNGIGIDRIHQGVIFDVFRRLHSRAEYPGEGIGLALCKRIVERHGGQIWVESENGKGSTFHFTLPKPVCAMRASGAF